MIADGVACVRAADVAGVRVPDVAGVRAADVAGVPAAERTCGHADQCNAKVRIDLSKRKNVFVSTCVVCKTVCMSTYTVVIKCNTINHFVSESDGITTHMAGVLGYSLVSPTLAWVRNFAEKTV